MLIKILRRAVPPYKRAIAIVISLIVIQTIGNLYLPNLNANLINNGVITGNLNYIINSGIEMIVITLALGAISVVAVYFASRTAMGIGRDLRAMVFSKVQSFSQYDMTLFSTASLITMNTNDIQQIQLFGQVALTMMVMAPVMAVGGVIMALRENAKLSLVIVVVVPLMALVLYTMIKLVVPLFQSIQAKIDRINQVLREQITGIRVVRAFLQTETEKDRFEVANISLTDTSIKVNRIFAIAMPTLMAILNLSSVAVVWFGGHLISSGSMPVGNLVAFITYITQIFFSVMIAVFVVSLLPRAIACSERIEGVLNTTPSIQEPQNPMAPTTITKAITFEEVSFGYSGSEEPILKDISLKILGNQTTAIIGGTGSGKTTLLNLIPRFYDPTAGRVMVNEVDVSLQDLETLWKEISIVPQSAFLFRGTIADNLRFGNQDASDQELYKALEIAQGLDFVRAMAGGLEAKIDQGGTNVSGGQRQRLAIARALVKTSPIYLFDDCFSALDATTDANLRAALKRELSDVTVVIVAQRVSTIMHADQIIVLDEGRVAGIGNHEELLTTCQEYQQIVESQLNQGALK